METHPWYEIVAVAMAVIIYIGVFIYFLGIYNAFKSAWGSSSKGK
jgi:hypothetical protein